MKHSFLLFAAGILSALPVMADGIETSEEVVEETVETVVGTDAPEAEGFVTHYLNNAIDKAIPSTPAEEPMEYGRKVTKWVSAPKFGGYAIGKYAYSSKWDSSKKTYGSNTFSARLIRLYVDGSILKDFKYRLQMEMENDKPGPHVKDFYLAWSHWKELEIKAGQFKRCFTFENPYNPWEVGVGDYSQIVKKLAGFNDFYNEKPYFNGAGEVSNDGGRDLGIQLQGDLFRVGKGKQKRSLVHYMAAVYNGQGINHADANKQKDFIGSLQVQPVKDLYIGFFGWTGNMTYKVGSNDLTVRRERYAIGAKYEHEGWSARTEYAHHSGTGAFGSTRADGWYVTAGVPCTKWLKIYAKYDVYRSGANWDKASTIYSIAPNFQLHKNLMFQLQYNYGHDRSLIDSRKTTGKMVRYDYHDLWVETYFRF